MRMCGTFWWLWCYYTTGISAPLYSFGTFIRGLTFIPGPSLYSAWLNLFNLLRILPLPWLCIFFFIDHISGFQKLLWWAVPVGRLCCSRVDEPRWCQGLTLVSVSRAACYRGFIQPRHHPTWFAPLLSHHNVTSPAFVPFLDFQPYSHSHVLVHILECNLWLTQSFYAMPCSWVRCSSGSQWGRRWEISNHRAK